MTTRPEASRGVQSPDQDVQSSPPSLGGWTLDGWTLDPGENNVLTEAGETERAVELPACQDCNRPTIWTLERVALCPRCHRRHTDADHATRQGRRFRPVEHGGRPDPHRLVLWYVLIRDAEDFRRRTGWGLASVWQWINREDYERARAAMDDVLDTERTAP